MKSESYCRCRTKYQSTDRKLFYQAYQALSAENMLLPSLSFDTAVRNNMYIQLGRKPNDLFGQRLLFYQSSARYRTPAQNHLGHPRYPCKLCNLQGDIVSADSCHNCPAFLGVFDIFRKPPLIRFDHQLFFRRFNIQSSKFRSESLCHHSSRSYDLCVRRRRRQANEYMIVYIILRYLPVPHLSPLLSVLLDFPR